MYLSLVIIPHKYLWLALQLVTAIYQSFAMWLNGIGLCIHLCAELTFYNWQVAYLENFCQKPVASLVTIMYCKVAQ